MEFKNLRIPFITGVLLFFCQVLFSQTTLSDNIKKAQTCFAQLDAENSYKDKLNHADMNVLPSGISQTIGNMGITLAVHSAEFYMDYTSLGIFLRLDVPNREEPLLFGAENIKLSHDGDIIGDARLTLMSDIEIPIGNKNVILRLKGNYDKTTGQTDGLTYISIDCKGFRQLGVSAEVELSKNLCSSVDANGKIIENEKVKGIFRTEVANWNDIVAEISFPSFEIKGLTGFIWNIRDAVIDFSDSRNDPAFTFPFGYEQYLIPGHEEWWKGVYVRELSVTLPTQFNKGGKDRVRFFARNMLIDDQGITGTFGADNLLSFNEGNASGWPFSVDQFSLSLMANHLEKAKFKGMLGLPISENTKLIYDGEIGSGDKYSMRVSPVEKIPFDLFQGKAELDRNSYVEFKVVDGKFRPEAMLHGRMGIEVALKGVNDKDSIDTKGKKITSIEGIEFRSLRLKTEAPYFTAEYFGYQGDAQLGSFPVSISEIALQSHGDKVSLAIGMDVTLMDGTFKGGTRVLISGSMQEGKLQRWKYEKIEINRIHLEATIAEMLTLKGGLTLMNDDPVYGDGFAGELSAEFSKDKGPLKGLKAEMRGMFGKKDFRYWFVDGIANIPGVGIPIGPSFNLTGFGGGIAYRMKPQGANRGAEGQLMTATSMSYVPDKTYSLCVKAATVFNFTNNDVAQGEACFELAFNNNGGLNYAGFYGYAQFMASIPGLDKVEEAIGKKYKNIVDMEKDVASKLPEGTLDALEKTKQYNPGDAGKMYTEKDKLGKANFTAALGIQFNFAESSFHASFDLYVNAAGGILRGAGANNRAGWAVIHVDPRDWYVHMGTPSDRIGLKFGIGKILSVETGSYLMVGTQIPAAPGIPQQVASILQEDPQDLDYMKNLNAIEGGKGFAFGSSMSINTGDLTFLILYANFAAGAGFDIMLKDYGDAQCKGRSGAIGMNGWYANGQAYAYLHGELGVKVNLWFLKAKVPIITADFAALLQAKLPNPSSFKAYIAVQAKVLGIVSVNCRFKLLIGEDCELVIPGGSPLEMAMISDLSPADKSGDINVFTAPQVTFNMAIEKPFNVQDDQGEKTFRIKVKEFILKEGGQTIPGNIKWNTAKDVASFYSHEVLPPLKDITATVNVIFEEYRNNGWKPVYTAGKEALETKTVSFRTTEAPENIPLENIVYSYPVVAQKYYLNGESDKGYIQLQFGQNYLFPAGFDNKVKLADNSGKEYLLDFKYNPATRRIEYRMPATQNNSNYKLSILSLSKAENSHTQGVNSSSVFNDSKEGSIDIENKRASAETRTDIGKELLAYDFSTSKYATLKQKVDNIRKGNPRVVKLSSDVLMFEYETVDMEPFDLADLTGTMQTESQPLISVSATLGEYFYKEKIYPLIYQDYPVQGKIRLTNRQEEVYGVPPVKALPVMTTYLNRLESNVYTGLVTKYFPYYYNLPRIFKDDFMDLQYQIINSYIGDSSNPAYKRFLNAGYPIIPSGNYKIKLQYRMPGNVKGTSSEFEYTNFIN